MASEAELEALAQAAERKRTPCSRFYEPDRGNELTAIALGGRAKSLVAKLPLTLGTGVQRSMSTLRDLIIEETARRDEPEVRAAEAAHVQSLRQARPIADAIIASLPERIIEAIKERQPCLLVCEVGKAGMSFVRDAGETSVASLVYQYLASEGLGRQCSWTTSDGYLRLDLTLKTEGAGDDEP